MPLNDNATMLALAALTYRGFYYRKDLWAGVHDLEVRRAVKDGLKDPVIRAAIGEWELVWGPATRQLAEDFDASAMYVVQDGSTPRRLVVAVRGTNPFSATDWVAGDFNVATMIPWPFARPKDAVAISTSSAFGLATLIGLTDPRPSGLARAAEESISIVSEAVPAIAEKLVRSIPKTARDMASLIAKQLGPVRTAWLGLSTSDLQKKVGKALDVGLAFGGYLGWPVRSDGQGSTLVDFLRQRAAEEPLEIVVTGHSKGGALAPVLALWLKETQPEWDSGGRVRSIGFQAFAGPTPGNGAFAQRVKNRLDDRSRRTVNRNDVVTHAWAFSELEQVPHLYGGRFEWTAPMIAEINTRLAAYDYQHVPVETESFDGTLLGDAGEVPEMIHQHLSAYLDRATLSSAGVDAVKLFLA